MKSIYLTKTSKLLDKKIKKKLWEPFATLIYIYIFQQRIFWQKKLNYPRYEIVRYGDKKHSIYRANEKQSYGQT